MKIKIKLGLSILVLSVISSGALAYEGQGYKIISEKITKSPGFIDGGFQETNPVKKNAPRSVNAQASTYYTEGRVREFIKVQGDHSINISNYTSSTAKYTYKYVLSCESAYEQFERTIEIYPQGNFSDSSHSYGTVQKDEPGTYNINASTQITGAESTYDDSTALLRIKN